MGSNSDDVQKLLELMFDPHETICASPNFYATESKNQSEITDEDIFLSINPIAGNRQTANVTTFRTFLMECDPKDWDSLEFTEKMDCLKDQKNYFKENKVPYSAIIFSGNKSYHYLLVLDESFANNDDYKYHFKWLTNILQSIDKQTGVASTSTRIPSRTRPNTKGKQSLVEIHTRVPKRQLLEFLYKHPNHKPKVVTDRIVLSRSNYHPVNDNTECVGIGRLSQRTLFFLSLGSPEGQWHTEFVMAVKDLKAQRYTLEQAEELLTKIEGFLDEQSMYQLKYGYQNDSWNMSYRPYDQD